MESVLPPHHLVNHAGIALDDLYNPYLLFLEKEHYDVEIINYMNSYMQKKEHLSSSVVQRIKSAVANFVSSQGTKEFERVESKLSIYPSERIHSTEKLKELADRYDLLLCGSDQVWNPKVTGYD